MQAQTRPAPPFDDEAPRLPGERSDLSLLLGVLRQPRVWAAVVVFLFGVYLIACVGIYWRFLARDQPVTLSEIFWNNLVHWLTINAGMFVAFLAPWAIPLRRRRWALRMMGITLLLLAAMATRFLVGDVLRVVVYDGPWVPFARADPWEPGLTLALMLYAGAGAGLRSLLRERERRLALARVEAEVAQARFRALKAQLRPRFLFDTLHAVDERIGRDVPAAEELLARTGEMLRLTFRAADAERVPLQQELSFAMLFLEIEALRGGGRVRFRSTAGPAERDAPVPHMSVFPLVESAVLAGAGTGPGEVAVAARRDGERLHLEVRDDVAVPLAGRQRGAEWEPVAALRSRLDELLGASYLLTFADRPEGGVRASLEVPLRPGAA